MTRVRAVRPGTPPRMSDAELRRWLKRHAAAGKSPPDGRVEGGGYVGSGDGSDRASDAQNATAIHSPSTGKRNNRKGYPMDLPDIEKVAAKVHHAWMVAKKASGIHSRISETGEELMKPFAELSEAAKELDRASVRAVYAAIEEAAREAG
jgi:hypothetical protein